MHNGPLVLIDWSIAICRHMCYFSHIRLASSIHIPSNIQSLGWSCVYCMWPSLCWKMFISISVYVFYYHYYYFLNSSLDLVLISSRHIMCTKKLENFFSWALLMIYAHLHFCYCCVFCIISIPCMHNFWFLIGISLIASVMIFIFIF